MSTTAEEDFRAFVVARWPDLEAVARVVVLDPELARRATTDALAGLSRRWREAVEDGRPGAQARRALLAGAVAAARPASRSGRSGRARTRTSVAEALPAPPWTQAEGEDGEDDAVGTALLATLAESDPLDRALVAARHLWDAGPDEVAALLGLPGADLAARDDALRDRLRLAHDAARAGEGLEGGGWLDHDLHDALTTLLRGQGDPPDPAGLVTERSGRLRRRHLVLGGVAAVAVAGLGTAAALQPDAAAPPAAPKPPPGPTDPTWARTTSWAARGPLAGDARTMALVSSIGPFGSRVLWAGDLGTRRLVVASYPGQVDMDGTELVVWSGARGQEIRSLETVDLTQSGLYGVDDLVALSMPDGPLDASTSLLVLLTRPVVPSAELSRYALPLPDGSVERDWTSLPLELGVSATVLDAPLSPALRVRVGATVQPPAGMQNVLEGVGHAGSPSARLASDAQVVIAALTGVAQRRLRSTVVVDEVVDAAAFGVGPGPSRVVVVHTRLPNGAVLGTAAFSDEGEGAATGAGSMLIRSAAISPSDRVDDPILTRLDDERVGVGRFLVVAPGAARVQLISSSPDGYPVSKVVRTGGRDASVVPLVNADLASTIRVIARDARGRTLFDGVPYEPLWLQGS